MDDMGLALPPTPPQKKKTGMMASHGPVTGLATGTQAKEIHNPQNHTVEWCFMYLSISVRSIVLSKALESTISRGLYFECPASLSRVKETY